MRLFLGTVLVEPTRDQAEGEPGGPERDGRSRRTDAGEGADCGLAARRNREDRDESGGALCCWPCSSGANFVAATFLAWLPLYLFEKFELELANSSLISTAWPLASLVGALGGGVAADWAARRSAGGRIRVQSLGLILAAPFVFLAGRSASLADGHRRP